MNLKSQISDLRIAAVLLMLIIAIVGGCSDRPLAPSPPRSPGDAPPRRIVSLAPSITEVLYALDLGDRVAGVTRFCDYPPQAAQKPVVGGYFDVNYEMVLTLKPDLVVLLKEHQDALDRLEELGIPALPVDHSRVEGILGSITDIARRTGVEERGAALRLSLENRIQEIRERYGPRGSLQRSPPRVLVAVGRLMDQTSGGELFISGRDGFYDDLIALAGGVNAYREETLKFPAISDEGLVRLDPDVILEMVPDLTGEGERQDLMRLWRARTSVRAVREGQVHILGEDYVVVPGPRFVKLLDEMARIISEVEN